MCIKEHFFKPYILSSGSIYLEWKVDYPFWVSWSYHVEKSLGEFSEEEYMQWNL